ncbi:hypothetical protein OKW96_11630 [Sphingobacterium sp. KU25419]|nr:hypothetical protein OKW96_11630 [Sphingobacterium sp. KU25419]
MKIGYEPLLSNTTALSIPIVSEVINFENINVSQVEFSLFIEKEKFFYKSLNSFLLNRKKGKFYFMNENSGKWEKLKKIDEL